MRHSIILLALTLTVAPTFSANPARAQGAPLPPLAAPRPLTLPKVMQETLPNGLRLVVLEDHAQPAVWLRLAIAAGTDRDPKDKVGLATMVANQLNKGTATRSESQIADTVDGLGATLGASASDDYLTVSANGLSAYTDTLFDLMADITLRPAFPDAEAARYKTRTLSAITSALSEAGTLADIALSRVVFGPHPYGNYAAGTPKTLGAITTADLKTFHDTFFAPNVATLFIVGDITAAQARAKAEKAFGGWQKKDVPARPESPLAMARPMGGDGKPKIYILDRPGAAQTEIRVGQMTPGYADPKRVAGSVATAVLGLGTFDSRLMQEIRVKRGLTYSAASFIQRNKEAGLFEVTTFTKNATTGETLKIALAEIGKLQGTPPPPTELADRKTLLTGNFALSVATPDGLLARLVPAVLNGNGPEDLSLYTSRVQAVTPQGVQDIFKNLPEMGDAIVLVGDAKEIQPQVADIGTVTIIKQDELDLLSPGLRGAPAAANPLAGKSDAEGAALLASTVKAHGGDAFLKIKAVALKGKGKLTTPPAQGSIEVPVDAATFTSAIPGRFRFDLKTGFGDIVIGSPGGNQGAWVMFSGSVQDQPGQGSLGSSDPVTLLVMAAQNKQPVAALTETATSADGKKLKGFAVTNEKGNVIKVFVDPDSSLVRRVEVTAGTLSAVYELSAYKDAGGGVQLPSQFKQTVNGQELFNFTFDSFDLNPTITDAMFEKPKG